MNESLETERAEAVKATLETLVSILKDEKVDIEARLKAARLIDGISDTMVHAYLVQNAVQEDASTKNKLLKGLDKLHGRDDEQ